MRILKILKEIIENESVLKKIKLTLHIIFLSIVNIINIIKLSYLYKNNMFFYITSDVFEFFFISISVYFSFFFTLKQKVRKKKILLLLLSISLIMTLAYFKHVRISQSWQEAPFIYSYVSIIINYIGMTTIVIGVITIINNLEYILIKNVKRMQKELKETKFQLLRQRFNPHFLFNALNSIYSMSINNNPNTSDTILKLSGMMRYLTDDLQQKIVPLNREIDFINEYIAIEKVRIGNNKEIHFNIEGNPQNIVIEPLLLFPLVENAFKHSNIQDKEGYIVISLKLVDGTIIFEVSNSIKKTIKKRIGTGNTLLKKRLSLTYSDNAELVIEKDSLKHIANLRIKQD